MDLSVDGHVASSTKDRTQLYDGRYFTPNEETGRELLAWLNQGDDPRQDAMGKIDTMLTTLDLSALRSNYWLYALNRYQAASAELLTEGQFQEQIALLTQCQQSTAKSNQLRDILQSIAGKAENQAAMIPSPTLALLATPGSISKPSGGLWDDHAG
jgi:hypothetical protein